MDPLIVNFSSRSLGSNISFLSALLSTGRKVIVNSIDYSENGSKAIGGTTLSQLARLFNIGSDRLEIVNHPQIENDLYYQIGDLTKVFSPYIQTDTINVLNQSYPVASRGYLLPSRPCIGLSCYQSKEHTLDGRKWEPEFESFPKNRYYTVGQYAQLFEALTLLGYDVITLSGKNLSLEHKMFLLNEVCDAVICYEGGLAHLAHILKVPTIILPWRTKTPSARMLTHLLHLDTRTYFADSLYEVLNWDETALRNTIGNLQAGLGNNMFVKNNPANAVRWRTNLNEVYIKENDKWDSVTLRLSGAEKNLVWQYILPANGDTFQGFPIEYAIDMHHDIENI